LLFAVDGHRRRRPTAAERDYLRCVAAIATALIGLCNALAVATITVTTSPTNTAALGGSYGRGGDFSVVVTVLPAAMLIGTAPTRAMRIGAGFAAGLPGALTYTTAIAAELRSGHRESSICRRRKAATSCGFGSVLLL
jgi:hypothetical protein